MCCVTGPPGRASISTAVYDTHRVGIFIIQYFYFTELILIII